MSSKQVPVITVRLTSSSAARLERLAADTQRSRSQLLRWAICAHLANPQPVPVTPDQMGSANPVREGGVSDTSNDAGDSQARVKELQQEEPGRPGGLDVSALLDPRQPLADSLGRNPLPKAHAAGRGGGQPSAYSQHVAVRVGPDLLPQLRNLAVVQGVSQSCLIRFALDNWIEQIGEADAKLDLPRPSAVIKVG